MEFLTINIEKMRNTCRTTNLVNCFPETSLYHSPVAADISPKPRVAGSGLTSRCFPERRDVFSVPSNSLSSPSWMLVGFSPLLATHVEEEGSYQDGSCNLPVELIPKLAEKVPESLWTWTFWRFVGGGSRSGTVLSWLKEGFWSIRGDARVRSSDEVSRFFLRRFRARAMSTMMMVVTDVMQKLSIRIASDSTNCREGEIIPYYVVYNKSCRHRQLGLLS